MIDPHGDKLVNKIISVEEFDTIVKQKEKYKKIVIDEEQIKDVQNIANGTYSPIEGFLKKDDFGSVVKNMRLKNNIIWSIPIVLDISEEKKDEIQNDKDVLLIDKKNNIIAILKNIEIYTYDKKHFAENVYKTLDRLHPGVDAVYNMKKYLIGGEIGMYTETLDIFSEHNFSPAETRKIFNGRGWNKIVAFQTRNVPHMGHEFLQKEALKQVDGLFIQPVIGEKKLKDFKDEYIISAYEILIDKHYPKNKVVLGILPLKMRYGGPREAVFHAIIRKNFGCTHFIVGRDHAGTGNYYPPFGAQEIFDTFQKGEMDIEIMKFNEVVFDKKRQIHCFKDECNPEDAISFSGTKLRDHIKNFIQPPGYIIRPEIYNLLTNTKTSLVDDMYKDKKKRQQDGFVLWFTGLSQSGKSTIADGIYNKLKDMGITVERLDGDVVRETLTKDLGFSKEDRDENIKRVGFVAKLLSRNGVGVISSFISPYKKQRENLRLSIENFIEIYTNTPLEVCEKRDTKGVYKKAREGIIKNFTGISDPYEAPENPEIELKPAEQGVDECVNQVIQYLEENRII